MKGIKTLAVLACIAAITIAATDASAYLHPRLGRFLQRDPLGYVDGMSLYEYVGSRPVTHSDRQGTRRATSILIKRDWGGNKLGTSWRVPAKILLGGIPIVGQIAGTVGEVAGKVWGAELGRGWGHFWIELVPPGKTPESYGWYPKKQGISDGEAVRGVPGDMNGRTFHGGTLTKDPRHGGEADESFHPVIREAWYRFIPEAGITQRYPTRLKYGVPGILCKCATERAIRACIRVYARLHVTNGKKWRAGRFDCRTFQKEAMSLCCLQSPKGTRTR